MKKKAFTLVELLVVIAILAILATVSILGYTNFTKKANYSNDTTLVTEWNRSIDGKEVLAESDINEKLNNVIEVKEFFTDSGTGEYTFTPKSKGYHFYWCEIDNYVYLVDDSNGFTVKYPDSTTVTAANSYRLDKDYYSVSCSIVGISLDKKLVAEGATNVEITLTATDVDMPSLVKIGDTEYTVSSGKITVASITSNIVISESTGITVTFDKQNGTGGTNSSSVTNGQAMPTITLPTRTGYIFNGYYSAENGGGTPYYDKDGVSTKNYDLTTGITLYAYWSKLGYFLDVNNVLIGDYFTVEQAGSDASLVKNITNYSSAHTVVLPDDITSIADYAFGGINGYGQISIKAVVIPSSVETIGEYAFGNSFSIITNNLESVTFDANSKLTSIGNFAFKNAKLTTITIPATASIGQQAFYGCNSLTTVAFATDAVTSETKTTIGKSAFSTLSELTTITIPNCVTVIGDDAFTKCEKLECVLFEENSKLETIGQNAFSNCSSIKEIVLPDSVKYFVKTSQVENDTVNLDAVLESGAFADCMALESITIPSNTMVIGNAAFARCTNLKTITFAKGTDGSKLQKIDCQAFAECSSLKEIEIPKKVTLIDDSAFKKCVKLETVTFEAGSNLAQLGSCVFCECSSLTAIEIPEGCTTLLRYYSGLPNQSAAFKDCTNLTSVTLPSTITVIGEYAFDNCSKLTTVTYLGTVEQWNNITFAGNGKWREGSGFSSITINGVAHTLVNDNKIQ